jgi:hypothetical protein
MALARLVISYGGCVVGLCLVSIKFYVCVLAVLVLLFGAFPVSIKFHSFV